MIVEKISLNHIQMIVVLMISVSLCPLCNARMIYVDVDATGANDGSRWADAYNCLQDALVDASTAEIPVEILVAQGVYRPDRGRGIVSGDRNATFRLLNGVGVFGGYAGFGEHDPNVREINRFETILNGELEAHSERAYQVVTGSGTDETAVLDGFTISEGNADVFTNRNGGGFVNEYGSPRIINCTFIGNSAQYYGGGIYNYYSNPTLINCMFIGNSADGGGIYSYQSDPNLVDCTFIENSGAAMRNVKSNPSLTNCLFLRNSGGGMYNQESSPILINCTFKEHSGISRGAGMYNSSSNPSLTNCSFIENKAEYGGGGIYSTGSYPVLVHCTFSGNTAFYGGGMYNSSSDPVLKNCVLRSNSAGDYGGAMYNMGSTLSLTNCVLNSNRSNSYGGGISCNNSDAILTHCTFSINSSSVGHAIACNSRNQRGQSVITIINSILGQDDPIWINDRSTVEVSYSNIDSDWPGEGNIDVNSLFVYAEGPDGLSGTEDDDLRLSPLSECVDAGDPTSTFCPDETDVGGHPRIIGDRVDMGAYEFQGILYVDDNISDAGYLYGTEYFPFRTIQEAINIAKDGYTVVVQSGVYDKIDFLGKPITVKGADGTAVIEAPSPNGQEGVGQDAVTFHTGEGPDSVLKNFIIKNSGMAISLNSRSQPTIANLTIVDNEFGIAAYENSTPDINNCIFWNNKDGDLFQCDVRYSCVEGGASGEGNISVDPLFVDAANGDYHLQSEGWRWSSYTGSWIYDSVTSRCVDAGDPASSLGEELMSVPRDPNNLYGLNRRINMGTFGGTWQASMPPVHWMIPEYETNPPLPNPAQWATDGEPIEVGDESNIFGYYAEMTAEEATDASGWVEYYFECTTESGFTSGWQSSPMYRVLVGRSGQGHRFRTKIRDLYGNETAWSEELPVN